MIVNLIAHEIDSASRDWDALNGDGWSDQAKRGETLTTFTATRLAAVLDIRSDPRLRTPMPDPRPTP